MILPYQGNRILMHLRELEEEIGFQPQALHWLETTALGELDGRVSYLFFCRLTAPAEQLRLEEGMGAGLFTIEDVMTGELYSPKMKKFFPVIPLEYVGAAIRHLWRRVHPSSPAEVG